MSETPIALVAVYFLVLCVSLAIPWVIIGMMLIRRRRTRASLPIGSRWTYRGQVGEVYFVAVTSLLFLLDSGTTIEIDIAHFQATATRILPEVSRGG